MKPSTTGNSRADLLANQDTAGPAASTKSERRRRPQVTNFYRDIDDWDDDNPADRVNLASGLVFTEVDRKNRQDDPVRVDDNGVMDPAPLLPVLVHIQAHLDEELSLGRLAEVAGLSDHHFHRVFKASVGETPKRYVERLRIERAAFLLSAQERTVLDVALEAGFGSHEVFSRAFNRRMGMTPSAWRNRPYPSTTGAADRHRTKDPGLDEKAEGFDLSDTRVRRLRPMHLAFKRNHGPYEDVPASLFDDVTGWVRATGREEALLLCGIGLDAPQVTAPSDLRFDACVRVPAAFEPDADAARAGIGYQRFAGGAFAITTYVGPLEQIPLAYQALGPRLARLSSGPRAVAIVGLPAVEIFAQTKLSVTDDEGRPMVVNHMDICLAVDPGPERGEILEEG